MDDPTLRRLPPDFLDRLRDLLATVRSAQALLASESDAARLARAVRLAVKQTGAAGGLLYLVDEDRNDLVIAAAVGAAYEPLIGTHVGRVGLPGFAIDDGTPMAVAEPAPEASRGDGEREARASGVSPRRSGSWDASGGPAGPDEISARIGARASSQLVAPILVFGGSAGALELRDAPGPRGFTPADVELAVELGAVAAAAVESHRGERLLAGMFAAVLPRAMDAGSGLADELARWIDEVRATPAFRRELALAGKLRMLARDDAGLTMVEDVVDAVLRAEALRGAIR